MRSTVDVGSLEVGKKSAAGFLCWSSGRDYRIGFRGEEEVVKVFS